MRRADARLSTAGVERRIGLPTPHFTAAVAAASDLVTTISAAFAARFAPELDLVLKPPPFDDAPEMTAVCTRLRAADPVYAAVATSRRIFRNYVIRLALNRRI